MTTRKRILYGVHGYGRGHAARALAILPALQNAYDVTVLAGDDAYDTLADLAPIERIDVLRYHHNSRGKRSAIKTGWRNASLLGDIVRFGKRSEAVAAAITRFAPDAIISDSEIFTHHVGKRLGIPRISFDHYGIMAFCRLEMNFREGFTCAIESAFYRWLVAKPDRIIAVAFYPGEPKREGVTVVGPILRQAVREQVPSEGEYLLAYFSNPTVNFTPAIAEMLHALPIPVKVYGPEPIAPAGNCTYCPIDRDIFLQDMAGCGALLSTAGNQLISEAIHLGKPMWLLPEEALEQQLNGRYVSRWTIGQASEKPAVTGEALMGFWDERRTLAANIPHHRRDGLDEAIAAIHTAIDELTPPQSL